MAIWQQKWGVHIYVKYAEYTPCSILHIEIQACIFFCIFCISYATQYAEYARKNVEQP